MLETLFHAQAGHLAQGEEIHTISEFFHLVARRGMKDEKEKERRKRGKRGRREREEEERI